jgi:hypothetical protein
MKYATLSLSFLILLSCVQNSGDNTSPSASTIDEAKTKEVFDHHMKTFGENDLDGIMSDYTDESILITHESTLSGLDEIRKNFVVAFKMLPRDSTTFQIVKTVIKDDIAYVIWNAKTPKFAIDFGTDTFVIQNGKIVRQTFALH